MTEREMTRNQIADLVPKLIEELVSHNDIAACYIIQDLQELGKHLRKLAETKAP